VVTFGEAATVDAVVALNPVAGVQVYVDAPLTTSVAIDPWQITVLVAEIVGA
jgi:hypothetical protein